MLLLDCTQSYDFSLLILSKPYGVHFWRGFFCASVRTEQCFLTLESHVEKNERQETFLIWFVEQVEWNFFQKKSILKSLLKLFIEEVKTSSTSGGWSDAFSPVSTLALSVLLLQWRTTVAHISVLVRCCCWSWGLFSAMWSRLVKMLSELWLAWQN